MLAHARQDLVAGNCSCASMNPIIGLRMEEVIGTPCDDADGEHDPASATARTTPRVADANVVAAAILINSRRCMGRIRDEIGFLRERTVAGDLLHRRLSIGKTPTV